MIRRFVSASAIAAVGIACAAFIVWLVPSFSWQRTYPLAVLWCFLPLVWGIWAAIAPSSGVPERLPAWGAMLGLIAGFVAMFVLNMPWRAMGLNIPAGWRAFLTVVVAVAYYFMWMLVRAVYRAIAEVEVAAPKTHKAAA